MATDVGGVSEAVGDVAGLVVPPRNPAALARACLRLLRDDTLRQTMGAAARARAMEHFTVDRAIGAFDEMYTRSRSRLPPRWRRPSPAGLVAADGRRSEPRPYLAEAQVTLTPESRP